jgi:hypothetical protein
LYFAVSERNVVTIAKTVRGQKFEASAIDFLQLTKKLHEYDLAVEACIYPPANTFVLRK